MTSDDGQIIPGFTHNSSGNSQIWLIKTNSEGIVSRQDSFEQEIKMIPQSAVLHQNYPNPFNPSTTIQYSLTQAEKVTLKIFNLQGQEIEMLLNEHQGAGDHRITWHPKNLPSGIYMYRLEAGEFVDSKKLILVK